MEFDRYSPCRLRKNQIVHNTTEILEEDGAYLMPAVVIRDKAQPDFGTAESPGYNIIKNNGPWALYHLGTQDIQAVGNIWDARTPAGIEALIYHKPDDGNDADNSGTESGEVHYLPFSLADDTPGNTDVDWSGRVDIRDLLEIQKDWHQEE